MMLDTQLGSLIEPLSGRRWSPAELRAAISARAAAYRAEGFARGDRAFIHFGNCGEFFVELLAVWSVGGCAVPIDTRFTPFEIETLAAWARPRASVWLDEPDAAVHSALAGLGVDVVNVRDQPSRGDAFAAPETRLDDDALILFTSGTTGQPKGVVHTHRSLRARWTSLRSHLGIDASRNTLCLLPTHFGHGLICNCLFPWLSGQTLHIVPPFQPDIVSRLGAIVDDHEITFMSSVPAVWRLAQRIAKPPQKGTLARVFVGSAPLSASLWETVRCWSGTRNVFNAYGITETGSWLAGTTVADFQPEDGLVGEAWGGIVRVLKHGEPGAPADPDAACAARESGQVWVITPALMRGYLDRDDLTAQVVSNGWFLTGDIGVLDDRGWLYLRGREREEINKGGMKVHPADIDAVVERFPAISDVCTFAYPEPLLGEEVGIAVVLDKRDGDTLRALYAWTAEHLARHQLPKRWYILTEIPRTSRGKVSRPAVAKSCETLQPVNVAAPGDG
jgi:acyl-CoA synthetase (AMP-forming)/AMP-acid ligase II